MIPIYIDTDLLMKCLDCKKRFWKDGNAQIGSPCPHCGSTHLDYVSRGELNSEKTFDLVNDELLKLQRSLKKKTDRSPRDYEKYNTLLDRWSKHKNK